MGLHHTPAASSKASSVEMVCTLMALNIDELLSNELSVSTHSDQAHEIVIAMSLASHHAKLNTDAHTLHWHMINRRQNKTAAKTSHS